MEQTPPLTALRRRQEAKRLRAAEMFEQGARQADVVRALGIGRSTASRWHAAWREGGRAALRARRNAGRPPRLSEAQRAQLEAELLRGPRAHGYETELWTVSRIGQLIRKLFGVRYHDNHVWWLLRRMGWSCQKPARQAKQRDEAAIERWRKVQWPATKRGLCAEAP